MDEEVPIDHSKILYNKCHKPYEGWWAPKAGHNNIDVVQRKDYFKKCYLFIESIKNSHAEKSEKEMLESNKAVVWDKNFNHFYKKFLKKPNDPNNNGYNSSNSNLCIEQSMSNSNQLSNENLFSR